MVQLHRSIRMAKSKQQQRVEEMLMRRLACVLIVFLFSCVPGFAQTGNATLSGRVTDQSKALIVGARVVVTNVDTNVSRETKTNGDGYYTVGSLPPGPYKVEIDKTGFENIVKPDLILHTQDVLEINFELRVGSSSETITVTDSANEINTSPAVSMTVTREFVENTPLNGRSFQDLIQLAPGTVSSGSGSGFYSIDGQRTDGNNFMVDGVSANVSGTLSAIGQQDAGLSGSTPSQTALGTTQSLVSIDALQEFKIQTSGYTAEYGRNPGGQVAFTTRSGTNDIHGTLFEYLRNTAFDAKSYQEDYYDQPKAAEHQNDFGGTVGGPLVIPKLYDGKDRTFFFISYEGLRLLTPAFDSAYVPTQAFRNWASPSVQPYLNSFPLPNPSSPGNQDGCTIPNPSTGELVACDALYARSFSNPSNIDSISVRLDQNLGQRFHIFLRYADTPSNVSYDAEQERTSSQVNAHTWTVGLTANVSTTLLNELRFNYSRDAEGSFTTQQAVAGSTPLARELLIPTAYDSPYALGQFIGNVPGSALFLDTLYNGGGTVLHQYQVVDSLTWTRGNHSLKVGGDWRRLTSIVLPNSYTSFVEVSSLDAFQQGYASNLQVHNVAPGAPVFDNLSLYAQDHWRISPRLSIDYGVRWEFNPAPGPSNGHYPATLTSDNLATATVAPAGTAPYKTSYNHFAPRFGFAWNAIPSTNHALTVRGGFGIFYDTAQQVIGAAYNGAYPFAASGPSLTGVPFPLPQL
jgi:hypothetical protein